MRNEHAQGQIIIRYMLVMLFFISAATGAGLAFRSMGFNESNIVIVYILSVLLTAWFTRGYVYGIFGSLAATVAFNFLFTEPHYSLSMNDPAYFITFAVMTVTAIITSALILLININTSIRPLFVV